MAQGQGDTVLSHLPASEMLKLRSGRLQPLWGAVGVSWICKSRTNGFLGSEPMAVLSGETPQMGLWKAQELPSNPLSLSLLAVTQSSRAFGTALCPTGGRDSGSSREAEDVPTAKAMPAFWEACKQSAAHTSIYTAWMALCCLPRIRPFGRLRNDPELPCFVFKSNPSGLDHGRLLFEISLLEELGLAPGMGDSPSLPPTTPNPPASLFCVSPLLEDQGEARARPAAFVQRGAGCTGVPAVPPCFPFAGSHVHIPAPHLLTPGQPGPPNPGNATAGTGRG